MQSSVLSFLRDPEKVKAHSLQSRGLSFASGFKLVSQERRANQEAHHPSAWVHLLGGSEEGEEVGRENQRGKF